MMALLGISPSTKGLQALASSVPIGQSGLVHILGRNDSSVTQALGISWEVRDPGGAIVEEYEDWSYGHGPGDDHEFIGGRFDLDKEGTYTLKADLLMGSPDNPVVVDSYEGALCTTTTEVPPEYELLGETIYPYAYVYDGPTEGGTITFKTDPFTPASWMAGRLASHAEDEIKKQGGRMLEMRVYVDKSPLLWADWRIDVISAPPETTAGLGVSVGIPLWVAIILVALALIALIIVTYTFIIKPLTYKHKPISEEIKATWSRETLISAIGDFEVKLERTPTLPGELDEKSDQELRDYCDQLAEVIAPPEVSWLPLAVIGGLGVLGVGAAVAFSMAGPRE